MLLQETWPITLCFRLINKLSRLLKSLQSQWPLLLEKKHRLKEKSLSYQGKTLIFLKNSFRDRLKY